MGDLGQVARRVLLELLEEHAVRGDLAEGLAVGGAGHRHRDRARRAVAREAHDAHVVAEVLAAELGADAEALGEGEDVLLELEVAEAVAAGRSGGGQRVEVVGRRVLRRLQRELRRRAADHDGEVVRRARRGAERAQLLVEEAQHRAAVQHRLGLLVQVALVGRAAALGHEQQLVGVAGRGVELDLGRQVGAGVLLVPHGEGSHLGEAQGRRLVGLVDAEGQGALVVAAGEHPLAALAHHDRGAGVLAHRQHAGRRDVGVLEQVEGDEAVVGRRLGVVEDAAQLREVGGPQPVGDVVERGAGQERERLGIDLEERAAGGLHRAHAIGGEQAVRRVVGAEREELREGSVGHQTRTVGWGHGR